MYELKIEQYEGPLEKLLELIEERKLEVTTMSLSAVTDDFLKYLDRLRAEAEEAGTSESGAHLMRLLADFVAVASRLLFIKSKALLPDVVLPEEEEADIRDLEARLRLLKELRPAMKELAKRWNGPAHLWSRPYFLNATFAHASGEESRVFYPSKAITPSALQQALAGIFRAFEKFAMETDVIRERVISLEAKIKEIAARLLEIAETSFAKLSSGASRAERVIAFLAILHLAREQRISLEQETHFSDIIIRKSNTNGH